MRNFGITDTVLPYYYPYNAGGLYEDGGMYGTGGLFYANGGAYYDDEGKIHYANGGSYYDDQGHLRYDDGGSLYDPYDNTQYKKGGIYIKPSKRGTFTAAASRHGQSVQGFASQVLANKGNYSPAMVKKANFARNASHWHHEDGGPVYANGGAYYDENGHIHYDDGGSFYDPYDNTQFKSGGGIHINPANKGKFTATKKRTGKSTEELTHSSNPLTRKRAIFAQNAKKWHHEYGGDVYQDGGEEQSSIEQQVAEALQGGANPHDVIKQLIQGGVDRDQAVELVRTILAQGQQEAQAQPPQQEAQMEYGGMYDDGGMYPYGGETYGYPYRTAALSAVTPNAKMFNPIKYGLAGAGILTGLAGSALGYTQAFSGGRDNKLSQGLAGSMDALMGYGQRRQQNPYQQYFKDASKQVQPESGLPAYTPKTPEQINNTYGKPPVNNAWEKYGKTPQSPYMKYYNQPPAAPMYDQDTMRNLMTNNPYAPTKRQFGGTQDPDYMTFPPEYDVSPQVAYTNNPINREHFPYGVYDASKLSQPETPLTLQQLRGEEDNDIINKASYTKSPTSMKALGNTYAQQHKFLKNTQSNTRDVTTRLPSRDYRSYAPTAIMGLGMANQNLSDIEAMNQERDYNRMKRDLGRGDYGYADNSRNPYGNYTLNPGVADWFQPGHHVAVQDYGTNRNARCGGQMKYKSGGEYQVSEEELLQLMRDGAEVEFL